MNTYINKDNIEWLTISRTIIGIIAIVSIVVRFSKIFIHRCIFMPLLVTKIIEKCPYKLVRFCFGLK